jgi:hypothetical protein
MQAVFNPGLPSLGNADGLIRWLRSGNRCCCRFWSVIQA